MRSQNMVIEVKVTTNAPQPRVVPQDNLFRVYVSASPEKGRANESVRGILSDYFKVRKSGIKIIKGFKGQYKKIEITSL